MRFVADFIVFSASFETVELLTALAFAYLT